MSNEKPVAPKWAGRVAKEKIARIYGDDARGLHDEKLVDDVAYTLLLRCESMLVVEAARQGRAACPVCEAIIEHEAQKESRLECGHCSWTGTWDAYRKSMDGLHLIAPGLQPFCREYIHQLRLARTHKEKVFWIDWLVHRCHWEGTAQRGQKGAASLIEGRSHDVHAFLSSLSSGTQQTPGVGDPLRYWSAAQIEQSLKWVKQAERRKCKRERTQNPNKASDATSEPAPGEDSSSHQG